MARLLILADMIDVHMLLMKLQRVEDDLEVLKSASSQAELIEGMERFGDSAHELMTQVNKAAFLMLILDDKKARKEAMTLIGHIREIEIVGAF